MDGNAFGDFTRPARRSIAAQLYPRLVAELRARGWSLADLARAAGLPYNRLMRSTSGYHAPSADTRARAALALGVSAASLWKRETETTSGARRG